MEGRYVLPDLLTCFVYLPSEVPLSHDLVMNDVVVSVTDYWGRISLLAADYRSSAAMYQNVYRQVHGAQSNEYGDAEQAFLNEMEYKNQLRLASHQYVVSLYHLVERVLNCVCEYYAESLGVDGVDVRMKAIKSRLEGVMLPDSHPDAKDVILGYGEMWAVVTKLRCLCNDIKHEGFVGRSTANSIPVFKGKLGCVVPDLTDYLSDTGVFKDAVRFINVLVFLLAGERERYIAV